MIQGIEYSVGAFEVFSDVILNAANGVYTPYLAKQKKYQATSITSNMIASSLTSEQPATTRWSYIVKLSYDGEIFFGTNTTGGSSYTYTNDGFNKTGTSATTNAYEWLCFGQLTNGLTTGGLSCLLGTNDLSAEEWGYVARLSCNGNRG